MKIVTLDSAMEKAYDEFLKLNPNTLFFASSKYKNLLTDYLNAKSEYLIAVDNHGSIKGALPLMTKESKYLGRTINSLPFFGSHGGVISDDVICKRLLLNYYKDIIRSEGVLASTLITSPFEQQTELYDQIIHPDFIESRIGQVSEFSKCEDRELDSMFHYKTRNSVRKAVKSGVSVRWQDGLKHLKFLYETHKENMKTINVPYKELVFFEMLLKYFDYGSEFRIYTAWLGQRTLAALLVFYFNKTAEYFIPATIAMYRAYQPMSLIINTAMKDAYESGYLYWNWGGTSVRNSGVYNFKKRWGTSDLLYKYFVSVQRKDFSVLSKDLLCREYPYFFVIPYSALEQ